jgi:uncharacterized protein YcbX
MPHVTRIQIHPIKGFDPVCVSHATVLASGALAFDRRWAFFDARNRPVNGKNYPAIHAVRAHFDLTALEGTIEGRTWSLAHQAASIAAAMSERFGHRLELREDTHEGFPDDTDSPGPTFVTEASLARVAAWFGLSVGQTRRRFRANIEADDAEPFWEDRLYGRAFTIGDVSVDAINPCARCIVPSRDAETGEPTPGFQKRFMQMREAERPPTPRPELFDHHYRFTVNTRIAGTQAGRIIREGDRVRVDD